VLLKGGLNHGWGVAFGDCGFSCTLARLPELSPAHAITEAGWCAAGRHDQRLCGTTS
jgi:hypothetical protein